MIEIRHSGMDSTASTKEAYNSIYRTQGILLRDSLYLWLISLLRPAPNGLLLDISCGEGRLVYLAYQQGLRVIGMDFAHDAVVIGNQACSQAGWAVSDGERLPLSNNSVDYVTHIGSLEHYIEPEAGMREIARVLKPNGVACVLVPNSFGLFVNIKHVLQTGQVLDDGQPLQRYNTPGGWHDMLIANGLAPFTMRKYEREWPRTRADFVWHLKHPKKFVWLLISLFVPLNLANSIVYLCRPR